jgi:hypothetical protein
MKGSLLLSFLCLIFLAGPAPAQNIWPVSFSYWFDCPDRFMRDLHGADLSIIHAQGLAGLCDEELRGTMQNRNQAMSQHELSLYNSPNMLPPIYPDSEKSDPANSPSAADKPSGSPPASSAPPARSSSPFPSSPSSGSASGSGSTAQPLQPAPTPTAPQTPSQTPSPEPSALASPSPAELSLHEPGQTATKQ